MLRGNRGCVAVARCRVVRRQDFDTGLREGILDFGMQLRVRERHLRRRLRVRIELIGHVEVIEAGLQDKRGWLGHQRFDAFRGGQQQFVHLSPVDVVADGDFRIEYQAVAVPVAAAGAESAADWSSLKSAENYLGYERTQNFASPGGAELNKRRVYSIPARLGLNHWALSGDWTMEDEATELNKKGGRIGYLFHARDLHLVMGPASRGTAIRFRVTLDGQPPGAAHGDDTDADGFGVLRSAMKSGLTRFRWNFRRNSR